MGTRTMAEVPHRGTPGAFSRARHHVARRIRRVVRRRREFALPLGLLGLLVAYLGLLCGTVALSGGRGAPRVRAPAPDVDAVAAPDYEAGLYNEPVASEYVEHVEVPPAGQLDGSLSSASPAEADVYTGDTAVETSRDPAELLAYGTWFATVVLLFALAHLRLFTIRIYDGRLVPAWRRLDAWLDASADGQGGEQP